MSYDVITHLPLHPSIRYSKYIIAKAKYFARRYDLTVQYYERKLRRDTVIYYDLNGNIIGNDDNNELTNIDDGINYFTLVKHVLTTVYSDEEKEKVPVKTLPYEVFWIAYYFPEDVNEISVQFDGGYIYDIEYERDDRPLEDLLDEARSIPHDISSSQLFQPYQLSGHKIIVSNLREFYVNSVKYRRWIFLHPFVPSICTSVSVTTHSKVSPTEGIFYTQEYRVYRYSINYSVSRWIFWLTNSTIDSEYTSDLYRQLHLLQLEYDETSHRMCLKPILSYFLFFYR